MSTARVTSERPRVAFSLPDGWTLVEDRKLDLLIACPAEELAAAESTAELLHFVTFKVMVPGPEDSWLRFVQALMRRRTGGFYELESARLSEKLALWAEWTDGVASMESWFVAPTDTSPLVEVCAGGLEREAAPRAGDVRALIETIHWLDLQPA